MDTDAMLEQLYTRLDELNESIYEPEGYMQPCERARRIRTRDDVYDQIRELEEESDS